MCKNFRLFCKANGFPFESCKNYLRFSSKSELIFDILGPLIISIIIVNFWAAGNPSFSYVFTSIEKINNQVLTAISILAGFNVASISVIASSQSPILDALRVKESDLFKEVTLFTMMMTFFAWAIVIQLLIILVGVIILMLTSFINTDSLCNIIPNYFWGILTVWIFIIIHSIFISLRNLKTLFAYIVASDSEHPSK